MSDPSLGFVRLAYVLGVAAAVLAFGGIATEMLEGDTLPFDRAFLRALRSPADPFIPIGPRWLPDVARDASGLGGTFVLTIVTLAAGGYLALVRKRVSAMLILIAVGGGVALSTSLKLAFNRPRPDLVLHAVEGYTASFPSGHATLSAITYLTLGALLARVQTGWWVRAYVISLSMLMTFLIGVSRIYLGVHWPTDVLAGWCVGSAWAMFCWLVALSVEGKAGS